MSHPILHALANTFAESASGRGGATRDFTIDYEKFLRSAGAADGDERELAEARLRLAERESGGALVIDRQPRSGIPQTLRLAREGGEAWLFAVVGQPAPTARREALAAAFDQAAAVAVPGRWTAAWRDWCAALARRARAGESVQPFKRGDEAGNRELLEAIAGVLNWQGESLERYASAVICGDSKRLQLLASRLTGALAELTGEGALERFGILQKPRTVLLHGSLALELGGQTVDFAPLPGPVALSETNLRAAESVRTRARMLLTVENEEVFLELAKRNSGVLLVQTSFPGAGVRRLFELLPPDLPCRHFGDTDPAGFDILRDLREKTGRPIQPFLMQPRPAPVARPFTSQEEQVLRRLIEAPALADLRPLLEHLLAGGTKGSFEQECIPIEQVVAALRSPTSSNTSPNGHARQGKGG
jgi:hypothetical protein